MAKVGVMASRLCRASATGFEADLAELRDNFTREEYFGYQHQYLPPKVEYRPTHEGEVYRFIPQLAGLNGLIGQYLKRRREPGRTQRQIKLDILSFILERRIGTSEELTKWQATCIIGVLKDTTTGGENDWILSVEGKAFLEGCEQYIAQPVQFTSTDTSKTGDPSAMPWLFEEPE